MVMQRVTEPFRGGSPAAKWAENGNISIIFDQIGGTITRLRLTVRLDVTTGASVTELEDMWDRVITSLAMSRGQKSLFSFSEGGMRLAYHGSRFFTPHLAPRRPSKLAASQTNHTLQFQYVFHFGVAPLVVNPHTQALEDHPFDLSAGIPPTLRDALTLSGRWGPAAAPGTGYTINSGSLWIDYDVVKGPAAEVAPMAIPVWATHSPGLEAQSSVFGRGTPIEGGAFLRSVLLMATKGTNTPRSNVVLSSVDIFNPQTSVSPVILGGQADHTDDLQAAFQASQHAFAGLRPPTSDGATHGVPAVTGHQDVGLLYLPLYQYQDNRRLLQPDSPLGIDLRGDTGTRQLRFGVKDTTNTALHLLSQRYELYDGN